MHGKVRPRSGKTTWFGFEERQASYDECSRAKAYFPDDETSLGREKEEIQSEGRLSQHPISWS